MRNFMPQDACQLIFIFHGHQQPAIDKNISGGDGKGIVRIRIKDVKPVVKQRFVQFGHDAISDFVDVVRNDRIFDDVVIFKNDGKERAGHLFFFTDSQSKDILRDQETGHHNGDHPDTSDSLK